LPWITKMADDYQQWHLPTKHLGQRVRVYDRLDSTNSLALSLATDPSLDGLAILTREQTAGRGQYGRVWHAPPGSSVLMTVLLFPPPELQRPAMLTAWAAVAVCDTVADLTNLDATIKWPNDVLVAGKKICGILIEQRTTGDAQHPLASAIGIGLNVKQSAAMFAAADLPLAASMASLSNRCFSSDEVAVALLQRLDDRYGELLDGNAQPLETAWKKRLNLMGRKVQASSASQTHRGLLSDLSFDGIQIEIDGRVTRLMLETIRQLSTEY
jgi:BirA family transcriptional regulator, biotin operon repressor / biotin---[acetyl-CoA-carboxylase] ligase